MNTSVENLKKLLIVLKENMTESDFITWLRGVLFFILKLELENKEEQESLKELIENKFNEIKALLPQVKDGHTPTQDEIQKLILPLIPKPIKGERGNKGENYQLTAQDKRDITKMINVPIVEKIIEQPFIVEKIVKEKTIEKKDEEAREGIKKLKEEIEELKKKKEVAPPTRLLGGVLNVGVRIEIPVGTIDGSNTVYVAYKVPKWVCVDGVNYFESFGYTYSGKQITTSIAPVNFIRSFY